MKTYVTYGFYMALAGFVCTLLLYFAGLHESAAKMQTANWLGSLLGLIVGITVLALGIKARRAQVPPTEEFTYGQALGAGVLISLFAALFGIVTNYVYFQLINPGMVEVMVQAQLDKMEAKGMSGSQLEQAEKGIRMFMRPVFMSIVGFVMGIFWGTVISLVEAAILKRKAVEAPPAVA
jgi:hypothetical protein